MKLNNFATVSHMAIEGYNITPNSWSQIIQCPPGTNGPLEWNEFSCDITIPKDVDKIRPILNAGWSSEKGKEAVTLFDAIEIRKISVPIFGIMLGFASTRSNNNLVSNPNFEMVSNPNVIRSIIFGQGIGHITVCKLDPMAIFLLFSL